MPAGPRASRRRVCITAAAAALALPLRVQAARPRVLIVGAGWAGLAALHTLHALQAPAGAAAQAELTLLDRQRHWRALPLSNAWLAGLAPERLPRIDLAQHAQARGARFVAAAVDAIDRGRRELRAAGERFAYDALLLATGALPDPAAWTGADLEAAALVQQRWAAGFAADELDGLHARLQAFGGGTLLMTVPPPPLRCPPAPYERALLLSHWMARRRLPGRIVLLDAGGGLPRLNRLIADRHAGRIEHRLHLQVQSLDPRARRIVSTEGEHHWDEALLLPPMHAGPLLGDAGLTRVDGRDGRDGRFAAVDPDSLRSRHDERIWLAGDTLDSVSPLFGAYPKTAEVAADLGAAAAAQIAAALQGRSAGPAALPQSHCHLWLQADPPEQLLLQARYRRRSDGVIEQTLRQLDNPQPRGEDLAWAQELLRRRLGIAG
jgi:NADPH-dependent 2,4-dienoyl-CoA reductase/sulfur reductase-like enzyme